MASACCQSDVFDSIKIDYRLEGFRYNLYQYQNEISIGEAKDMLRKCPQSAPLLRKSAATRAAGLITSLAFIAAGTPFIIQGAANDEKSKSYIGLGLCSGSLLFTLIYRSSTPNYFLKAIDSYNNNCARGE
jgi:hypothetical protein